MWRTWVEKIAENESKRPLPPRFETPRNKKPVHSLKGSKKKSVTARRKQARSAACGALALRRKNKERNRDKKKEVEQRARTHQWSAVTVRLGGLALRSKNKE